MSEILVVVDHVEGAVKKPTYEMLTLAARIGEPSAVFIGPAGKGAEVAEAVKKYGAGTVYVVDDDAWLQATMRGDQAYAPMVAALDDALRRLDRGSHAHRRLFLMREFLVFVGAEMGGIAERWLAHRAELERGLG